MPPTHRLLTLGLLLTTFGVALEALSILPVAPQVARELPDGVPLYGLMFAGFFLGSAVGILISGPVVDRRGPAPVLIVGLVAFTVGLLIGGLAPTMQVLIVGRVIQGAGAGMVGAVSFATVALAFAPAERPRILALISLAWLLPSFVGPLAGGLVADALGWRWVFLGLAVLMPLCALLVVPQVLALPRGGVDGVPVDHGFRGLLPPHGQIRVADLAVLLGAFAVLGTVSFAPLALADLRGLGTVESGITVAILSISWTIATFAQGRLHRVGTARITRVGLCLLLAGLPVIALTVAPAVPMPLTWVGWALAGLGAGFTFQGANLHVMAAASIGAEGRATASAQLANTLGSGAGTWLGGVLVGLALGAGVLLDGALAGVFSACIAAAIAGLLVALRLVDPVASGARGAAGGRGVESPLL